MLHRANLPDDKVVDTPIGDPTPYRELVGCPVYLTVTRPDIAYTAHIVSQFVSASRSTH